MEVTTNIEREYKLTRENKENIHEFLVGKITLRELTRNFGEKYPQKIKHHLPGMISQLMREGFWRKVLKDARSYKCR